MVVDWLEISMAMTKWWSWPSRWLTVTVAWWSNWPETIAPNLISNRSSIGYGGQKWEKYKRLKVGLQKLSWGFFSLIDFKSFYTFYLAWLLLDHSQSILMSTQDQCWRRWKPRFCYSWFGPSTLDFMQSNPWKISNYSHLDPKKWN